MSAADLLAIMGAFRREGAIVSPARAQAMLDAGLGIDAQMPTPLGTMYSKSGYWKSNEGSVEQSLLYFLPQDMELVVLVNSPIGAANRFFPPVVDDAYMTNVFAVLSVRKFLERRKLPVTSSIHTLAGPDRSVRHMIVG